MASGSIERRPQKDGTVRYRAVVWLPPTATDKPERKTGTFRTKKEAEAARNEWQAAADNGQAVPNSALTVEEVCEAWLTMQRPRVKPGTLEHYEHALNRFVVPHVGKLAAQRVRPTTIDALYAVLREKGASEQTIHRVHQRLKQVFDYAAKRRVVAHSPMQHIDAPTIRPAAPTVLTAPHIRRFLAFAAEDGYAPLWLLLLQTGLRRGEALGVRWQDLDLERGKLSVRQCVESLRGLPHMQTPKTAAARRTISLFPESVTALKAHRTRQLEWRLQAAEWEDNDLVFCTDTGKPVAPTNALRSLKTIQQKANAKAETDKERDAVLPRFDIHDLRHTHASHLLRDGWDVVRVSRRLGHANPAITMGIYAHLITDERDDAPVTPAALAFTVTA